MSSIIIKKLAMAARNSHRSINADIEGTRSRVSSGYRAEPTEDNAPYWSIAATMRSDREPLSSAFYAFGAARTDTDHIGLNSTIDIVTELKARLVAARNPGVNKRKNN